MTNFLSHIDNTVIVTVPKWATKREITSHKKLRSIWLLVKQW